ncbi:MAG: IclR family transcriptional regulator [Acidimicrobiaceae bacterium]|nr:IclR family transcriptional regulator [Acidimicrobiaceae bacterium]
MISALATNVPAVSAAVRILECLAQSWPEIVTPSTLVNELKLNRSTCYNILGVLEQAGWVTGRDNGPGWTLGPRLLVLTGVTDNIKNEIAQREIEVLSAELGFVVFIVDKERGGGYRVVGVAEQTSGVRVTVSVGDGFPFSAPAIMQSFFAWTDDAEVEQLIEEHKLLPFTEKSITSLPELREALARVRERGYSESIQQFNMAQGGVAAPIFDSAGRVRQVICSLAFSSELDDSNVDSIGRSIRRCAEVITSRSGGIPPVNYGVSQVPG